MMQLDMRGWSFVVKTVWKIHPLTCEILMRLGGRSLAAFWCLVETFPSHPDLGAPIWLTHVAC